MSNRLRRKSRPQADIELFGGPLKQKDFRGGINLDRPASEIGENQLANAENVICFDHHVEARPGTKKATETAGTMPGSGTYHAFVANKSSLDVASNAGQYILHRGSNLYNLRNPIQFGAPVSILQSHYATVTSGAFGVDSTSTIRPFNRGNIVFTSSKIAYLPPQGGTWFQINAPNPVHGFADDTAAASAYERRYLVTLSRIVAGHGSGVAATNRLASGAILEHESGSNGARYYSAGTQTRDTDYATVYKASAFGPGAGYTFTEAQLKSLFSSSGAANDNSAAQHFTHVSIWGTLDIGSNGRDPETNSGNSRDIYVWLGDVNRDTLMNVGGTFSDDFTDAELRARMKSGLMLVVRGFEPLPSGDCGEATESFIFVSSRSATSGKGIVYYSQVDFSPENMGYYFPGNQFKMFGDSVMAMRASQDVLSVFCTNSTHTCTLTAFEQTNLIQANFILTHWTTVDETLGVRDWGTISQVDRGTMIAVCSDASVRLWDTTKWGPDLSYDAVNTEITKIVPANPSNTTTGSFGIFYKGAYHLWYSKDSSDTNLTNHLRYGFGGRGGNRWTKYTGFIRLPFRAGATVVVDDANRVQRLMGISTHSSANGYLNNDIYWLETFESFSGASEYSSAFERVATDGKSSGGAGSAPGDEITCRIKFRELTANEESHELVHQETHAYLRPMVESVGYRTGFQLSLVGYENGSATASETISDLPKTGDWHFTQELSGRRIQLELVATTGQFRFVGIDSHCRSLDRINYATAGDNSSSENTASNDAAHQLALSYGFTHWISRRYPSIDMMGPTTLTASGSVGTAEGPDGKSSSALSFSSSTYSRAATSGYGNFTLAFGMFCDTSLPAGNIFELAAGGGNPNAMSVSFTNSTTLSFSGLGTVTVSNVANATWSLFAIIRSGSTISVYQNGSLVGTITSATGVGGGNLTIGRPSGLLRLFDIRVYADAKTAANMAYWYTDIVSYGGGRTLPMS